MQRYVNGLTTALAMLVIAVTVWLWGFGGAADLQNWATNGQRAVQDGIAAALQGLRSGEPGALIALWSVCFAYGFFHAAGPGHGKLLIGGYGVGTQVALRRLAVLAVLSSLAQAACAVAFVYGGVALLGVGREAITGFSDEVLAAVSYAAIAGIGVWLVLRGIRRWRASMFDGHAEPDAHIRPHAHTHVHRHSHAPGDHDVCSHCGHKHGPDLEEAARITSLREAIMLIGAVAIRPCTGALFLLILTWRFSVDFAGIAGAFIMGLGTATVTLTVACAAVTLREGFITRLSRRTRVLYLVEIAAGSLIAVVSLQFIWRL